MSDVFRTMIVPDAYAPLARGLSAGLSPVGGAQMYETGLSPGGAWPPTHWISSGHIAPEYAALMPLYEWLPDLDANGEPLGTYTRSTLSPGQPGLVAQLAEQAGQSVPLAQVQALFDAADITTEDPFVAMARLGVQITYPPETAL